MHFGVQKRILGENIGFLLKSRGDQVYSGGDQVYLIEIYKEYQRFGIAQNDDFSEFPRILHENHNFHRNRKIFCAVCATFRVFGPARPGCAGSFKTNAIPSLFRFFW